MEEVEKGAIMKEEKEMLERKKQVGAKEKRKREGDAQEWRV